MSPTTAQQHEYHWLGWASSVDVVHHDELVFLTNDYSNLTAVATLEKSTVNLPPATANDSVYRHQQSLIQELVLETAVNDPVVGTSNGLASQSHSRL